MRFCGGHLDSDTDSNEGAGGRREPMTPIPEKHVGSEVVKRGMFIFTVGIMTLIVTQPKEQV